MAGEGRIGDIRCNLQRGRYWLVDRWVANWLGEGSRSLEVRQVFRGH